jgi:hypothetical protein
MHGILHPRPDVAQRPGRGDDVDGLTTEFLASMRRAAVARFDRQRDQAGLPVNVLANGCRTFQMSVPATGTAHLCGGVIVAHVSGPAFAAWVASQTGSLLVREDRVTAELQLVLQDLCDHDVQGCLTLTESQCEVYDLDLVQLVAESLDRTSFSRLQRQADIHWEGTLAKSLDPPVLVLVVSIGLKVTE